MLRKLPGYRLEAFQPFGKTSSGSSALPCQTQIQKLILCLLPDSPICRDFLNLLILSKGCLRALGRGGCIICELIQRGPLSLALVEICGSKAALYSL